jgi:hypothetical protein
MIIIGNEKPRRLLPEACVSNRRGFTASEKGTKNLLPESPASQRFARILYKQLIYQFFKGFREKST